MKTRVQLVLVCAVMFCTTTLVAGERAWRFKNIDVSGSRSTVAFGIAPSGEVVGTYVDSAGKQHGFLRGDGELTTIDVDGAGATDARGIAPDGTIVGVFRYPGEPGLVARGYVRRPDGFIEPANFPDHISTIPQRIMPDGTIVGCYHDNDMMDSMRGMVMAPSGNSELDLEASMINGSANGGRVMVGLYTEMDTMKGRAFIVVDGQTVGFDYPEALATSAWDVNAAGIVVGAYVDADGLTHGFTLEKGEFTSVDFPGATATTIFGINARGDIVGRYVDANRRVHAFHATRTANHNQGE